MLTPRVYAHNPVHAISCPPCFYYHGSNFLLAESGLPAVHRLVHWLWLSKVNPCTASQHQHGQVNVSWARIIKHTSVDLQGFSLITHIINLPLYKFKTHLRCFLGRANTCCFSLPSKNKRAFCIPVGLTRSLKVSTDAMVFDIQISIWMLWGFFKYCCYIYTHYRINSK